MKIVLIVLMSMTIISCNPSRLITPITAVELTEKQMQDIFSSIGAVSVPTLVASGDTKETNNKVKFDFSSENRDELYVNKSGNNFQIYIKGLKDTGTFQNGDSVVYTKLYFAFADGLAKQNSSLINLQDSSLFRLKPSVNNDTLTVEGTFQDNTSGGKGTIRFIFELKEKIDDIDIKYSKDKVKEKDFIRQISKMTGESQEQNKYKPLSDNAIVWEIYNTFQNNTWSSALENNSGLQPSVQPDGAISPIELAQIVKRNIEDAASLANLNVEVEVPSVAPENKEPLKLVVKLIGTRSYLLELEDALKPYKEGKKFNLAPGSKGWSNSDGGESKKN